MSSQIQCQSMTLKGVQCKRKASKNCNFCKQHSDKHLDQHSDQHSEQHPEHPEQHSEQSFETVQVKQTPISGIRGPKACVFKHKKMIGSETHCCFKNTLGEFVCKNKKFSSEFCKNHYFMYINHNQKLKKCVNMFIDKKRQVNNFNKELIIFIEYAFEIIKFKKNFVIFSQDEFVEKFIELFHMKHEFARESIQNLSMININKKLSEIRNDVENLCVSKQIEISKQEAKMNEIKLNMLTEIYIKDSQNFAKPVFTNLVNDIIFSMLV